MPPAPSKKCKSGAPEHDECAPESGTKERQRGPRNCLDVRVPSGRAATLHEDTKDRVDAIPKTVRFATSQPDTEEQHKKTKEETKEEAKEETKEETKEEKEGRSGAAQHKKTKEEKEENDKEKEEKEEEKQRGNEGSDFNCEWSASEANDAEAKMRKAKTKTKSHF